MYSPRYGDPRSKVSFVPGGVLSPEDILRAMPYFDPVGVSQFEKDQHSSQMGSWETHTRGIGSRLLAKMGYLGQGGLGVHGNGRLVPVAILLEKFQILPRSWNHRPSLDRLLRTAGCSHKRSSRNKRSISHSRTTVDRKGIEGSSVRQPYLFQFINSALRQDVVGNKEPCSSVPDFQSRPQETLRLKKDCQLDPASSEFRVQVFRTHEEINRTKQQIHRTRESIERNQGRDRVVTKQAEQRLITLQAQLDRLRTHERTLQQSKNKHSTEKKLRIF
ncbi:Zinc finger CCCH-type with G patch domain-containing protein [Fasciolopsis buskii]|uniref:Zinc finger CCCH-type with G patch domain-containing protein n=1 Tax=Fasciolopsis buskii TaxID=27845 RepID=A0A8E0RXD2_9TREM|nr:Zinc finger CCCH-type with G patch domain-containing protein [Fasciolopsis buski]